MSFNVITSDGLKETLKRLKRKDTVLFKQVQKKINQVASFDETTIQHFKNLKGNLSDYKRVHIGSFVLFFEISGDIIIFDRLVHHDEAY